MTRVPIALFNLQDVLSPLMPRPVAIGRAVATAISVAPVGVALRRQRSVTCWAVGGCTANTVWRRAIAAMSEGGPTTAQPKIDTITSLHAIAAVATVDGTARQYPGATS